MILTAIVSLAFWIPPAGAGNTTDAARKLIAQRIDTIAAAADCRHPEIDLERVRRALPGMRFYNAAGADGALRFSRVVGAAASPDLTLRQLARESQADAFVLGYFDGGRYVRTRAVVLARGYFEQPDGSGGVRPTTEEEKQALLLHEALHIAMNKDDDELDKRELCPLRLLAFCQRGSRQAAGD